MGFKLHNWFRRRRSREEKSTAMVLTVTEDTPADMLTGSMELLVQLPRDHHVHSQRVTVERRTAMMDLLVQIATAHKLAASSYTLQAIGERGVVLPHQPNTPIGALDALQVKLLPKQGTFIPRKAKQPNQPFETTFRLQVHLPRNQLYVSRVSPKMNLGEILEEVCREKNLDRNKYELRHPGNHKEVLDPTLSLQDYHLQEVTLYAKQGESLGSALSSQDIMALQRQEDRRRQQAKQSIFGFMFRKSKESSLSTDSLGDRSVSPAHSDETGRSVSPLAPPTRPQRKRRPAPNPPVNKTAMKNNNNGIAKDENKEKLVISHSRNSSDSSGYHEASVLSDNPDSAARMPETLPRRSKPPGKFDTRKLAHTSQASKSLSNLALTSASLSHATSNTSLSSNGIRKKRAAPPPPMNRSLSSAISTQALERIVDSEESLTSDMGISKPPSDIGSNSKANSDIAVEIHTPETGSDDFYEKTKIKEEERMTEVSENRKSQVDAPEHVETARVDKRVDESRPIPKPRKVPPKVPERRVYTVESSVSTDKVDFTLVYTPTEAHLQVNDPIEEKIAENCTQKTENTSKEEMKNVKLSENSEFSSKEDIDNEEKVLQVLKNSLKGELDNDFDYASDENSSTTSKHSCTVISTIPKCCHLTLSNNEEMSQKDDLQHKNFDEKEDKLIGKVTRKVHKSKVFRSQSAFGNFEVTRGFEKNNRGNNSHPDNFNCALNQNFSAGIINGIDNLNDENMGKIYGNDTPKLEQYPPFITHSTNLGLRMDLTQFAGEDEFHTVDIGKADKQEVPSDTDILLQKVSTTLATVLPSPDPQDLPSTPAIERIEPETSETANQTLNSQQDTSDYVSATGEELSGADWEYQLPDPPSAFRDSQSPEHCGYETITLSSVEAFKDPIAIIDSPKPPQTLPEPSKTSPAPIHLPPVSPKSKKHQEKANIKDPQKSQNITSAPENPRKLFPASKPPLNSQFSQENRPSDVSLELKKHIISELETKIENGGLIPHKIPDESKKILNKSSPRIAPVDNTLSNFTITTYSNQKTPNIYNNSSESDQIFPDASDDRIVKTFATFSRNRSTFNKETHPMIQKVAKIAAEDDKVMTRAQSVQDIDSGDQDFKALKIDERFSVELRPQRLQNDQKTAVHRSKSYIVLSNNSKYREDKKPQIDLTDSRMYKSTSYTNLNQEIVNNDELQSVQVLKSILPHINKNIDETSSDNSKEIKKSDDSKRYKWTGPPAISLGSWSERPSINVQIKHDSDYKFGTKSNKNCGKTVVNLNSTSNDVDIINYNLSTKISPKKLFSYESNELRNSKIEERPSILQEKFTNKFGKNQTYLNENPGELNKSNDVKIDTRPVNFKELTQTFGQVNLRNRSCKNSQNRHSDFFDCRPDNDKFKQEIRSIGDWPKVKRYTSVIGINPNMNFNGLKSDGKVNNVSEVNGLGPVVKGFKSELNSGDSMGKFNVPTPPTMPIITGVTLKSTNARPIAVTKEPRDQLLESIRNFGRDKLKRCVSTVS